VTALPSILNQMLDSRHLRKAFPEWGIWGMKPLFQETDEPVPVEAISGACMLARREVLEQVGCFTTAYFMYSEDMDLCLKVAMTGAKIYYVPEARIVHHAGGSSSQRKNNNFSNIVLRESMIRFFGLYRGRFYAKMYRISATGVSACRIALIVLVSPIAIHPNGYRFVSYALSKWTAIFLWSLGLYKRPKKRYMPQSLNSQVSVAGDR
jgi:N-acetylglucosaminyl-diphospho-decaprenol L-rhamnosyltransferase